MQVYAIVSTMFQLFKTYRETNHGYHYIALINPDVYGFPDEELKMF